MAFNIHKLKLDLKIKVEGRVSDLGLNTRILIPDISGLEWNSKSMIFQFKFFFKSKIIKLAVQI